METPNPRNRRSLVGLIRGDANRAAPQVDEPRAAPRVWANAGEMLADQFASGPMRA